MMKDPNLLRSVDWLLQVQNKDDGGWGMHEHDPSRIVTTSEAVTALAIAGVSNDLLKPGIDYLLRSGKRTDWCRYTRHHAWTVYALIRAGYRDSIPQRCIQALQKSRNDGWWSHEPRGEPSIFATFLAWRALNGFRPNRKNLTETVCNWLVRQIKDIHWTFQDNRPSFAATSYAVLVLTSQPDLKERYSAQVGNAVDFLRTINQTHTQIEHEPAVSGAFTYNFHHCILPWTLMALLAARVSVFEPLILQIVDRMYTGLYCETTGGWAEEEDRRPNVFGTAHVIAALEIFYNSITVEDYLKNLKGDKTQMTRTGPSNDVFIVHGHDNEVKQEIARFLEKIGCNAIILEEQVVAGATTIFQKFMDHADRAAYAIVLLTPDDMAEEKTGRKAARARQNVILEFGFFIGKLGPDRVCLAKKGDVDIPSDIAGVLYLNLNDGGWKLSLASKLRSAGLSIDLSKI